MLHYNNSSITYVELDYLHTTDWTTKAKVVDYDMVIFDSYVDLFKPFTLEYGILRANTKNDLRRVLSILINHQNILDVFGLKSLNYGYPKKVRLVVKGIIGDSTRYLAHMYNGTEIGAHYKNGVEKWGFLFPNNEAADSFINEISKHGKVINVHKRQINNVGDYIELYGNKLSFILNDIEAHVLSYAYKKGFFDFPKKVLLKDLASDLGLSSVTVDRYIRSAVRKILKNIFEY